ncbi:hypothetical protein ACFWMX_19855 [Streptomyces sp. NPDC058378]|uniref:hypothetical protein n=1 Tax=Streptomyces sp. NPDC058378 TaxID=3346469 RepID=UPI003664DEA2
MAIESKAAELAARRCTDHHAELLQSIVAAAEVPDISEPDFASSWPPPLLSSWPLLSS